MYYGEPEENIANWVVDAPPAAVKPARYKSRHNPKKPPTASCFGVEGTTRVPGANRGDAGNVALSIAKKKKSTMGGRSKTTSNPRSYLKGSGKDVIPQGGPKRYVRPYVGPKKAGPPAASEKPVMGLQTTKNFLVANAVENILAVPKKVSKDDALYVAKKDYGVVPEYLTQVKAAIEEEKAVLREYLEEEQKGMDGPQALELPEGEKKKLLKQLKRKWDSVNKQYQKISHQTVLDTINKLKKKEGFEAQLEELERTIEKLEGYSKIYIE
jgi:hypothetical protein